MRLCAKSGPGLLIEAGSVKFILPFSKGKVKKRVIFIYCIYPSCITSHHQDKTLYYTLNTNTSDSIRQMSAQPYLSVSSAPRRPEICGPLTTKDFRERVHTLHCPIVHIHHRACQ